MVQLRAMVLSEQTILLTTQSSRAFSTVKPRFDPEQNDCNSFLGIVEFGSAKLDLDINSWEDAPKVSQSQCTLTSSVSLKLHQL